MPMKECGMSVSNVTISPASTYEVLLTLDLLSAEFAYPLCLGDTCGSSHLYVELMG